MLEFSFLYAELLFTVIWLLVRAVICLIKKKVDWKREVILLLMYVNLAVIIRFTFFPMATVDGKVQPLVFDASTAFPFRINWIPLVNLLQFDSKRDMLLNVIGNFAMFIPSGVLLPILYKRLDSFWKVTAAGALISLCIEIIQLPFSVRASDVDDLILNTLGVMVGYGIYALVKHMRSLLSKANKRGCQ